MSLIESKLQELDIKLPETAKPVAAYVPAVQDGDLIYVSGQLPFVNGTLAHTGKVGGEVSVEDAYEAAKICALNGLSAVKSLIGDLDKVVQIVKVTGFVNSTPDFEGQPKVVNGASEILFKIFGEKGSHSRSAVGVAALPMSSCCEVELIVKVQG